MVESFQTVYSASLGWHKSGVSEGTKSVGWEGRGVVRGDFTWGAGGWDFLFTTVCCQMRLNVNMTHYRATDDCSVTA